jgi:enoyl-CoA hydratase/carnithine racemase
MSDMQFKTIVYDRDGPVLTVILNRPEKLNAFSEQMFYEVARATEIASHDPAIRVVVFKGAGRAFSSGADLGDISEGRDRVVEVSFEQRIRDAQRVFDDIEAIPKPTIAAVNGHAVGAGLQLALACDFRIVVRGVKLGLSDVKIGIIPALGATTRLPKLIGMAKSKELILSGDLISSEEALEFGLVNRLVEGDSLDQAVQELVAKLISRAPLALAAAKDLLNAAAPLERVAAAQSSLFKTNDAVEGITAFLEKRPPKFTGS